MLQGYVYILTNKAKTVLYTGVTSDLIQRVHQHKSKRSSGFSNKYNCNLLVYYEVIDGIEAAIQREKQIKAGSRANKEKLINSMNPSWKDLYYSLT
ncbi:GIY-YIG nuclease family protein [Kangiella japonica]|uniref:GIY-YIG nuclease family protein n=1 Tax=Kangiella japonica TaxID=647384 RepID=A0ABP3CEN9_9GAMM